MTVQSLARQVASRLDQQRQLLNLVGLELGHHLLKRCAAARPGRCSLVALDAFSRFMHTRALTAKTAVATGSA